MLDHRRFVIMAGAGLLALASMPVASAEKASSAKGWKKGWVCTPNDAGEPVCRESLPTKAKVAIAIVTITVVFLLLAVFLFVRRSRKQAAEAAKECSVEDSQMQGPPTVLHATYNPGSGHSIYAIGSAGSGAIPTAVIPPTMTPSVYGAGSGTGMLQSQTPAFSSPAVPQAPYSPAQRTREPVQPMTAPAHRSTFSQSSQSSQQSPYPFSSRGNAMGSTGQPPKSAFVSSGGFPRPLLAGRLKDRIRDRPESVSSLPNEFATEANSKSWNK